MGLMAPFFEEIKEMPTPLLEEIVGEGIIVGEEFFVF